MRYYILSPLGRTGSQRIYRLIEDYLNRHTANSKPFHLMDNKYDIPGTVKLKTGITEFEVKYDAEVQELLRTRKDNTAIHSNVMVFPPDLQNWTIIHCVRKSKAEQIMSWLIASYTGEWSPGSKDIKFEPFEVEQEEVLRWHTIILSLDEKVKEMFPNCIEIFMEDDYHQIEQKLSLIFSKDTIKDVDKYSISNHRYPDLITNYLDVFKWCGEEPPV